MRCYLDSSALLKRVIDEAETEDLRATLTMFVASGWSLVTSDLAQVEVMRACRRGIVAGRLAGVNAAERFAIALGGVELHAIDARVIAEAGTVGGDQLRSLDAIHLATALLVDADMLITYDERLLDACREAGMMTAQPGALDATLPPGWEWVGEAPDVATA